MTPEGLSEYQDTMLTREQKLLFARLIFNAKEILFADSANSEVTKPEKASKWFEILMQLNSVGANIPDYKTIRDQEWSNMRRAVEKKVGELDPMQRVLTLIILT